MEEDDGLHIKKETVDDQNNTFQIKEEDILQWDDSPDDTEVQIKEQRDCSKTSDFALDDQNETFLIKEESINSTPPVDEEHDYPRMDAFPCQYQTEIEVAGSHGGIQTHQNHYLDSGSEYTHSSLLMYHKMTDTSEQPYTCYMCGKTFSRAGNLRMHIRIHSGEKPCNGGLYGKAFTEPSNLRRHKRHRNVIFVAFTLSGHVNQHTVTPIKVPVCLFGNICCFIFFCYIKMWLIL